MSHHLSVLLRVRFLEARFADTVHRGTAVYRICAGQSVFPLLDARCGGLLCAEPTMNQNNLLENDIKKKLIYNK